MPSLLREMKHGGSWMAITKTQRNFKRVRGVIKTSNSQCTTMVQMIL